MASYRVLLFDLLTRIPLAEMRPNGLRFGYVLNGAGSCTFGITVDGVAATNTLGSYATVDPYASASVYAKPGLAQQVRQATEPGKTLVCVERDGVIVWAGSLLQRTVSQPTVTFAALELWSEFRRDVIRTTQTFTATDQLTIAQSVVARTAAALGVTVGGGTSGVLRDRTYWGFEAKNVGEAIEQLAAVIDGFDFVVSTSWSGSPPAPVTTLSWAYPRRGSSNPTGSVFELGKNVRTYELSEDASSQVQTVIGIGAGEGDAMVFTSASKIDSVTAAYPARVGVLVNKDVSVTATLTAQVQQRVNRLAQPAVFAKATVDGGVEPTVGQWSVGDLCTLRIRDGWYPDGLDVVRRIVGADIAVTDEGIEDVTLTLSEVVNA